MPVFLKEKRRASSEPAQIRKYLRYAIGEVVLLVIGILIALQINNWNDKRKERKLETFYLENLMTSIGNSKNELFRVQSDSKAGFESSNRILRMIADEVDPDLLELDSLVFLASDHSIYSADHSAVNEIISSGKLNIIRDEALRTWIASWNSRMHEINKYELHTKEISQEFMTFMGDYLDVVRYLKDTTASLISEQDAEILMESRRFRHFLAGMANNHSGLFNFYQREDKVLDSMSLHIQHELQELEDQ